MSALKLPPIATVGEVMRLYRIRAKKNLSQNFLFDMNMCRKIVRSASHLKNHFVCEVGPGPGGITQAIIEKQCRHLTVIEKDARFLPSLKVLSDAFENQMSVIHGDILNFNMENVFPEELKKPWKSYPPFIHIIGNLPFNISTPLLIKWLADISERRGAWSYGRTRLTLTFQKEVAERIVAPIAADNRCRLSVICQHLCDVNLKFIIPGKVFVPPPKVDVGVVSLVPLVEPKIKLPFKLVEKVLRHIFHHRNKKCFYGIKTLFPENQLELAEEMLEKSGVKPSFTSYQLSMEDYNALCHAYNEICLRIPAIFDYDYRAMPSNRLAQIQKIAQQMESDSLSENAKWPSFRCDS